MTPDEEIEQLEKDWNMSLDIADGWQARYKDAQAELASLRAELEQERSKSSESNGETTGSYERGTVDQAEIRRLHGLIASLHADLAEARADVGRFEAALDAANRELAQARAERDEAEGWSPEFIEALDGVVDLAYDGKAHYLEPLHPKSVPAYQKDLDVVQAAMKRQSIRGARTNRSRATIAALVVACRAMWLVLFGIGNYYGERPKRLSAEVRLGIQQAKAKQAGE